ncbi:MAG: 4-aminobutyrate aminotransferase-like enzyme [Candidatus Krumholzibacteriia bacterium]|jgi:4-aminobutyrate aminotransferase-like enzyme
MTNSRQETLRKRGLLTGKNLSLAYDEPLKLVEGRMQYVFDERGQRYLDAYNNVPHVGHCHPRVVEAACRQLEKLNTNTRYLSDHFNDYAEALLATMPSDLDTCFFLNSASEANELAVRMSRQYTNRKDMIVTEAAYHGHTSTLIDLSPYKHNGAGGNGAPEWVHTVPLADGYRGEFKSDNPQTATKYARQVADKISDLKATGKEPAAFIAESYPSVGGQIIFPDDYLSQVYAHVRAAGGLCIADEVQTGLGRIGTDFYAFAAQGVSPDIVVLGKPIGNGFPLAALITRNTIAEKFANGMEFFSTFGGNTVACAIGKTVLAVVQEEKLQAHALAVGDVLLKGLHKLKDRHEMIGDVRGKGLFLGIELVKSRDSLEPAPTKTSRVVNKMKEAGVLIGTDGPLHNVLKIRPPMPFNDSNAETLLSALDEALSST